MADAENPNPPEAGIDRSGASRYADRLEAAGLIERSPDPSDGRATLLALIPRAAPQSPGFATR